ncbi:MAG: hypothetical protein Q4C49_03655 [Bacillota bacterium]|nr:hypothetical protein [Bacillota bacterium]
MFTFIFSIFIIGCLFSIGFAITGAILSAILWFCIQLPVGLICIILGIAFCLTILLFPLGKFFCKLGIHIMFG